MSELTLDPDGLTAYLPHRGVNVMPDSVTMSADRKTAVSHTAIPKGDKRGREIFSRQDGQGNAIWSEAFLFELMALTGVPLLHERLSPAGQIAVFSMISRLRMFRHAPLHQDVVGYANITRDRGNFTVFATKAEVGGQQIMEAEVISGAAVLADIGLSRKPMTPTRQGTPVDASWYAWKPRPAQFVDRIVSSDAAAGKLIANYVYPATHPLVPGHFPAAALMMGVTQFAAIVDAAVAACRTFQRSGRVLVVGGIKRQDGTDILDVRDLVLNFSHGIPGVESCKRIAFRDPVIPGDEITIEVEVKDAPQAGC